MDVNDELALADVEALLRRTLRVKAAAVALPPRPLDQLTGSPRRRPDRRYGWAAAAACAVAVAGAAGLVVRAIDDGAAPAAPATTPTVAPPPMVAPVTTVAGPDPEGPHTAYATITVEGGLTESLTMVGDDIDTSFGGRDGAGRPQPATRNRRVDGVLYVYFRQLDGSYAWTYDPDDVTTLSLHPSGHTPFELYDQVAEAAAFQQLEETDVDGIPVRHIRATTPEAVDSGLLRLAGNSGEVTGLELWVTADNVVLRSEVTLAGDPPSSIVVEFDDVGDPGIELAAPEDAIELDGVG